MAKIFIKDGQISSSAGISIPGNLSIPGNVTISGNVVLGDNFTDTLTVNSNATFNDDLTVSDILSGSIGRFTIVTASFTGSGAGLYNLTASGINNFTNDVRAQFSAGTNITIVGGVISSTAAGGGGGTPGGLDTNIQFNSGSTFSGSNNLIYNYITNTLSGTTAQFTDIITNTITGSSINITGTLSASSAQSIIKSDQGISFRTRGNGTGSFIERMFIGTNDIINAYASLNTNSVTASVLTANVVTASVTLTGSIALFTTLTGSTVTGTTSRFTTITGSTITGSSIIGTTSTFNTYQASAGSTSAVSYGFGSSGIDTGLYRPTTNVLGIVTNGAEAVRFVNQTSGAQIQMDSRGGTAVAPALTWYLDNNCGIFRPEQDTIGFTTNATERMRITNTQTLISGNLVISGSGTITGSTAQFTNIIGTFTTTAQNITGTSNITNGIMYFISAATADYTINLPAPISGGNLYLIRTDATAYIITISGHINGTPNTNNNTWFPASTADRRVVLVSNGTSWYPIIAGTVS